jgi:hypothetical protein
MGATQETARRLETLAARRVRHQRARRRSSLVTARSTGRARQLRAPDAAGFFGDDGREKTSPVTIDDPGRALPVSPR